EYWINKKKFIKEMSMSHTELKNEHKEDEGDPLLKFSRKALHQEILSQDLVQRVKNSKVVIVEKI
ncbi:MAG: EscU/YscU/HrcU family type III secretion system export apparatus switch protein, partial [Bdellovibrionales bacterium]|nr:EscU/YscU/HrcU family type III secretion system export apparatus switch protein [Bdellovibrionales bacterium]